MNIDILLLVRKQTVDYSEGEALTEVLAWPSVHFVHQLVTVMLLADGEPRLGPFN